MPARARAQTSIVIVLARSCCPTGFAHMGTVREAFGHASGSQRTRGWLHASCLTTVPYREKPGCYIPDGRRRIDAATTRSGDFLLTLVRLVTRVLGLGRRRPRQHNRGRRCLCVVHPCLAHVCVEGGGGGTGGWSGMPDFAESSRMCGVRCGRTCMPSACLC